MLQRERGEAGKEVEMYRHRETEMEAEIHKDKGKTQRQRHRGITPWRSMETRVVREREK